MGATKWLILFVKAPVPGHVKTRLRPLLSDEEACQLYRCLVLDTLEAVKPLRGVRVVVAYAADPAFPDLTWLNHDGTMFLQHGNTLGERLIHALECAFAHKARAVVALGSDAPDLSTQWVRRAFQHLSRSDVVVGPTEDGGYQLIGLAKPHPELFLDMPWSSSHLFKQTLDRIRHLRLSVHVLSPVTDLDTPEDLWRYVAQRGFRRRHTHTARFLREALQISRAVT